MTKNRNKTKTSNQTKSQSPKSSAPSRSGALVVLGVILMLGICLAGARFVYLQVIDAQRLGTLAEQQRIRQIETPAQRGTIFDRSGRILAQSVRVYTVAADPRIISDLYQYYYEARTTNDEPVRQTLDGLREELASYFETKLEVPADDLLPQFSRLAGSGNLSRYAVLARQILPDVRTEVTEYARFDSGDTPEQRLFKQALQHTVWELGYMRIYPLGEIGSQVIGFVNAEGVGAAGIEMQYEDLLRGSPGVAFTERDVAGNVIPAGLQRSIDVTRGSDIMLTIDAEITYIAQQEIENTVQSTGAESASAIVMNPRTGEIYAAVSYPGFDSNEFGSADLAAMRNRGIVDTFEPGSSFKPITFAAAFNAGAIELDDTFYVPNTMQVGTRVISDSEVRPSEVMNISRIMEISSNVGTTRIAQTMGDNAFYEHVNAFGIAERPGVDFPGAARGIVHSPAFWNDVTLSNNSFGQGISMTPLQLARAISAIANEGLMPTPHFLRAVPDGSFDVPQHEQIRVVSAEAAALTSQTLKAVMIDGTGSRIQVEDYTIAGKTGTAQKAREGIAGYIEGLYVSSFIGYLPAEDPELLISIFVDEPNDIFYGGEVAGPPFANIATFTTHYLGMVPN